ncbi:MAG: glutathione S-transferase family protein [Rhizomicrobium sp.]|nr:glutathione S-transferase family protein [Rhizomicrobium sp.]
MTGIEVMGVAFSNYVRAVRMALEEKGVPYTLTPCRPHTAEIDAIHPLGKIPCLKHGDFTLCESKAIATYVDRGFPGIALFPAEAKAAALVEQWVSLENTTLIPHFQTYMACYFFPRTADGEPDPAAVTAAAEPVAAQLKMLDRVLTGKSFLAADVFSYADINLLTVLAYLRDLPESGAVIADSPALVAYLDTHSQRASFVATLPPPTSELLLMTRAMVRERMAKAS